MKKVRMLLLVMLISLSTFAKEPNVNLKTGAYLETDVDKENYYSFWEDVKKEVELI